MDVYERVRKLEKALEDIRDETTEDIAGLPRDEALDVITLVRKFAEEALTDGGAEKKVVWVVRAEQFDGEVCYFEMAFSDYSTAFDICNMGQRDAGQYCWGIDSVPLNDTDTATKTILELKEV